MESTASKLMRDYVQSQNFSNTADIMAAMKELFRDALRQVMEGELETMLGCRKKRENVGRWRKQSVEKL